MHSTVVTEDDAYRMPDTVTLYRSLKCDVEEAMDRMVKKYCVLAETRRWPVVAFYSMISMAALNAHVLYRACTGKRERRAKFLMELVSELAAGYVNVNPTLSHGQWVKCQVNRGCENNYTTTQCDVCNRYTCDMCV